MAIGSASTCGTAIVTLQCELDTPVCPPLPCQRTQQVCVCVCVRVCVCMCVCVCVCVCVSSDTLIDDVLVCRLCMDVCYGCRWGPCPYNTMVLQRQPHRDTDVTNCEAGVKGVLCIRSVPRPAATAVSLFRLPVSFHDECTHCVVCFTTRCIRHW